ncbi:MAG TPA: AAA family ATPase [Spirochaetia bacterium]|nr:AAA family ATPase [Spirochaetia bacterium]
MGKPLKIGISGKSGCGNTTVSRLVAERLGIKMINYTFKQIAVERSMDFMELCRLAQTDSSWDLYLDRRQIEMANEVDECVLGSRLAVWLLENADLKVYLTAPIEVRAARIQQRDNGLVESVLQETLARDRSDHERYLKLYGLDNNKYEFVDLIVNTEHLEPQEVAQIIIRAAEQLRAHETGQPG